MEQLGRARLAIFGLAAALCASAPPAFGAAAEPVRAQALPVTLKIHGETGLQLHASPDGPVRVSANVRVQMWTGQAWKNISVDLRLIAGCPAAEAAEKPGDCVTIQPNQVFEMVGWTGNSCGEQCPAPCRANLYYGPGKFRYVVEECKGGRLVRSPAFELPAQPK